MNGEEDDRAIVGRVLSGDTEAFRLLVDRYSDRLWRFCRARLGDDSDAEDAVQDVFVRAFRSLRSFKPTGNWSSWLFAIAANRVKSRYAAKAATAGLLERAGMEAAAFSDEASASLDPAAHALDTLASENLRSAVARLPVAYRTPVELYYFAGLGVSEVAKALGLGEEAVKTRLFRARKELSSLLDDSRQPGHAGKGRH